MNKKIFALLLTIFMISFSIHIAEPVSAAKVIDKGHTYCKGGQFGDLVYWTTYRYNSNHIVVKLRFYNKKGKKYIYSLTTVSDFKKVSKNKLKETSWIAGEPGKYHRNITTKLSTSQYYWKIFRKTLK